MSRLEKVRCYSFHELKDNVEKREQNARSSFLNLLEKSDDRDVIKNTIANVVSLEIYNQLLVNDYISGELRQWISDAEKMDFYKHETKKEFKKLEKRRMELQRYTRRVVNTNDGFFVEVAELFDEKISGHVQMIYLNIKQEMDRLKVPMSAFRARLETIKLLVNTSIDIQCEIAAGASVALSLNGFYNNYTDMTSALWMLGNIEDRIGFNELVENANIDNSIVIFLQKIACAEVASECFNEVRMQYEDSELPDWFPRLRFNNKESKDE